MVGDQTLKKIPDGSELRLRFSSRSTPTTPTQNPKNPYNRNDSPQRPYENTNNNNNNDQKNQQANLAAEGSYFESYARRDIEFGQVIGR